MTVSPFGSEIYKDLFSDDEVNAIFSDHEHIRSLIKVEVALAEVQGELNIIPIQAAKKIKTVLENIVLNPKDLAHGTARDGIVVPTLVKHLRQAVGGDEASFIHYGVTSQDILDTALVLQLRKVFEIFETRLVKLIGILSKLADQHKNTVMAARTRSQISTPTTFGLRAANWLMPFIRHQERLLTLKERLVILSIGGASGTLSALSEEDGIATAKALEKKLSLGLPPLPWHNQRDNIAELGAYCGLLTGSSAKIANDIILLASSGINEVSITGSGKSSTMPQKNNPVAAEAIVALAKTNIELSSALQHAQIHNNERDGAAWQIEWINLPRCLDVTATCFGHLENLLGALQINSDVMMSNIDRTYGTILAEAASILLSNHMVKVQAQEIISKACITALETKTHLFDILAKETKTTINWQDHRAAENHIGLSQKFIEHTLAKIAN